MPPPTNSPTVRIMLSFEQSGKELWHTHFIFPVSIADQGHVNTIINGAIAGLSALSRVAAGATSDGTHEKGNE